MVFNHIWVQERLLSIMSHLVNRRIKFKKVIQHLFQCISVLPKNWDNIAIKSLVVSLLELGNYMAAGNHTVLPIKDEPRAEARSTAAVPKPENEPERYSSRSILPLRKLDSELSLSGIDIIMPPPPPSPPPPPPPAPPPPPPPSAEKVMMKPIASVVAGAAKPSTRALPLTSVRSFTISSLQQYTNSFSQDNLIGSGMLGSVYRAELPDGKV